jgi:hypothetical protein
MASSGETVCGESSSGKRVSECVDATRSSGIPLAEKRENRTTVDRSQPSGFSSGQMSDPSERALPTTRFAFSYQVLSEILPGRVKSGSIERILSHWLLRGFVGHEVDRETCPMITNLLVEWLWQGRTAVPSSQEWAYLVYKVFENVAVGDPLIPRPDKL